MNAVSMIATSPHRRDVTPFPNHRYTTSPTILNQMVDASRVFEGDANTKVFACVPL
jgi:hypothetical protein